MMALVNFAAFLVATVFAVAAAAALSWISLRVAFVLIEPRRASGVPGRAGLAHATARLTRAFATRRRG